MTTTSQRSCFSPLDSQSHPSLSRFNTWLDEHGVSRHDALDVLEMEGGGGYRIVAKGNIPIGTILCDIPKPLLLSHRTCALSTGGHLPLPPLAECTSSELTLHLAACLLHELRLGSESRWGGWLQFVPREVIMIPTLWGDEAIGGEDGKKGLRWLQGTGAGRELDRKDGEGLSLSDMRSYYTRIKQLLPSTPTHPQPSPTSSYLYAMSLISSRAFVIDAYHGIALVPFVDFFNHSSLRPHTSLLSTEYVCPECGSLPLCSHDEGVSPSPETDGRQTQQAERLAHLPPDRIARLVDEKPSVDMRAEREIEAGEEIFSCYEEGVGDNKLLVEWGFMEGNGIDGLEWSPREVFAEERSRLIRPFVEIIQRGIVADRLYNLVAGADRAERRELVVMLEGSGGMGSLQVNSDGRVSLGLFIAVHLITRSGDMSGIDQVEKDILDLAEAIEQQETATKTSRSNQAPAPANDVEQDLTAVSRTIMDMLDERESHMYSPEVAASDLSSSYEKLDISGTTELEMLGRAAALREKKLIQEARSRWRKFAKP